MSQAGFKIESPVFIVPIEHSKPRRIVNVIDRAGLENRDCPRGARKTGTAGCIGGPGRGSGVEFSNGGLEKWQSAPPLSHAYIDTILQQAQGNAAANPQGLASLEACAGAYSRAFAAATVTPNDRPETRALTPAVLALIARDCIRHGESLHLITVTDGRVLLTPVGSWDITGDYDPATWMARCDVYGPTRSTTLCLLPVRFALPVCHKCQSPGPRNVSSFVCNLDCHLRREYGKQACR